jgi:hypothetical protein
MKTYTDPDGNTWPITDKQYKMLFLPDWLDRLIYVTLYNALLIGGAALVVLLFLVGIAWAMVAGVQ